MGNGAHGLRGLMCNIKDRDGVPWGWGNGAHDHNVGKWVSWLILKIEMRHMGHGAHGQCGHVLDHVQLP